MYSIYDFTGLNVVCYEPIDRGTVVKIVKECPTTGLPIIKAVSSFKDIPCGILIHSVISNNIDSVLFHKQYEKSVGSPVEVLLFKNWGGKGGTIIWPFDEKLKIGTHIYYTKLGKLTTNLPRNKSAPIAIVLASDNNGYSKLRIIA